MGPGAAAGGASAVPLESASGASSATDLEAQPDGPALSRRIAYVNDAVAGMHRSLEGEASGTAA